MAIKDIVRIKDYCVDDKKNFDSRFSAFFISSKMFVSIYKPYGSYHHHHAIAAAAMVKMIFDLHSFKDYWVQEYIKGISS